MDPFSLATGVAGLLPLALQLIKLTNSYIDEIRNAPDYIANLKQELSALAEVLDRLEVFLKTEEAKGTAFDDFAVLCKTRDACHERMTPLAAKLEASQEGGKASGLFHRIKWPLKSEATVAVTQDLSRYAATFHFALNIEGCALLSKTSDEVSEILRGHIETLQAVQEVTQSIPYIQSHLNSVCEDVKQVLALTGPLGVSKNGEEVAENVRFIMQQMQEKDEKDRELRQGENKYAVVHWLATTEPSVALDAARKKHYGSTGKWFLENPIIQSWQIQDSSLLWLYGKSGCGKTILSSTIIDELTHQNFSAVVAYYFFDQTDERRQSTSHFLRSLISQICSRLNSIPCEVQDLYEKYKAHRETTFNDFVQALQISLRQALSTYIVVDALDECSEIVGEGGFFALLSSIHSWNIGGLHILVTSRHQTNIDEGLCSYRTGALALEDTLVKEDIKSYIVWRLKQGAFRNWTRNADLLEEVQTTVEYGADGSFRWVALQLDSLERCLNPSSVRKALKSLPKTLEQTYDRVLESIHEDKRSLVLQALQWIAFAGGPLSVAEVAEVMAISSDDTPAFDPDNRPFNNDFAAMTCSSFITIHNQVDDSFACGNNNHRSSSTSLSDQWTVVLSHPSVKDYLASVPTPIRIRSGLSKAVTPDVAWSTITKCCIAYLLHFSISNPMLSNLTLRKDFHLLNYIHVHLKPLLIAQYPMMTTDSSLDRLLITLMTQRPTLLFELRIGTYGSLEVTTEAMSRSMDPLIIAVRLGIFPALKALMSARRQPGEIPHSFGDPESPQYLALKTAIVDFRPHMFSYILEKCIKPIQNCCRVSKVELKKGYEELINIILNCGPDDAAIRHFMFSPAATRILSAAENSYWWPDRREVLPRLNLSAPIWMDDLLQTPGETHGSALHAAAFHDRVFMLQALLENGTDIDLRAEPHLTALHAAATRPWLRSMDYLVKRGADVNATSSKHGSTLSVLVCSSKPHFVKYLLGMGARINTVGGKHGSAVNAAIATGNAQALIYLVSAQSPDLHLRNEQGQTTLEIAHQYDEANLEIFHGRRWMMEILEAQQNEKRLETIRQQMIQARHEREEKEKQGTKEA